ncbi:PREDICTED: glutathione S-transferase U7-like [Nicotiana attenuata]|uniref:glutathione transferase n=1 Tax=Nicotiana attenuata TaxID=49451 RepID=A0A1J6JTM3_NICAT|nr:PREDICTED: glutathione S-transferase U7-like [Nicotiana attenuata]OIT19836.1 glutathione s-transferase u7 [Nicotiana attenuata]
MEERADLKLVGTKESLFTQRIVWALKLKGIDFEFIEQDISSRSSTLLLVELNPVYKKVPVIVHFGKPLSESLVILEYIEETWPLNPLLPLDPFDRASARFWARFIDGKFYEAAKKAFFSSGETKAEGVESVAEGLQLLEGQITGKKFFGGEKIGYVDIVVGWIAYWFQYVEEVGEFKAMDSKKYPYLNAWINNFIQVPVIQQSLPKPDAVKAVFKGFKDAALAGAN